MANASAELRALYEADQADRSADQLGVEIVDRDRDRRHRVGPSLAHLEAPGVIVRVIAVPADAPRAVIEPLPPGKTAEAIPAWLPDHSTIHRYGSALCAVGPDGGLRVFWQPLRSMPHVQGWRWPDRQPVLRPLPIGVLISGAGDDLLRLVTPHWLVGAALPLDQALRVASSLPEGNGT